MESETVVYNLNLPILIFNSYFPEPLLCPYCGVDFKKFDRLVAHCRQVPGNADKLRCFLCDRLATDEPDLVEHLQTTHVKIESSEVYACENCQRFFFSQQDLDCHTQKWCKKKSEDPTKMAFLNALNITSFERASSKKVHKCVLCSCCSLSEGGLMQHMVEVHSLHVTTLLSNKDKTQFCGKCGQVFSCFSEFVEHKERCEREFEYYRMDENSPLEITLNENETIKIIHAEPSHKKSSSSKKTPTKSKPQCPNCYLEFKTKNTLNVHKRSCLEGISL